MIKRSSGILLPIFSLPSKYGIGCFDDCAYKFVDLLKEAGQTYWQLLPLCPTSYGDSPYQSFSTFAGNPYFISLDALIKEGWLTEEECKAADMGSNPESIDYHKLYESRFKLLHSAYERADLSSSPEFESFCGSSGWLDDYALFMALKDKFGGVEFTKWDDDIRLRKPEVLKKYTDELSDDIKFQKFMQFCFDKQWNELKQYANDNGIKIIGDIPIYVAADSADAWSAPDLFELDENGIPTAVAGCPPDAFTEDGQLWGNPLYNWERHKETGYKWWISRLEHCFKLYDVVRIDHFRGFDEYWSVPYGEETARNGEWLKGPGYELFKAIKDALGERDVIAEDLGFMTDSVKQLVSDCGFPNMKILEFAFDLNDTEGKNDYLPHNYGENCVAYTGTHDNQTLAAWFQTISSGERKKVRRYIFDEYTPNKKLNKPLIALLMRSHANMCIIPMQDWLGLDDRSRINIPSTVGGNWKWRMKPENMSDKLFKEIRSMTSLYGR